MDNKKFYFLGKGYFDARFITYTYFRRLKGRHQPLISKNYSLVLDIGCGSGTFINSASQNIVGVDINFETLRNIKKNKPKQALVQADARHLPFKSNFFDLVTSFSVLEHVRQPQLVIDEIYRVSKNEGLVTAQTDDYIPIIYDPLNAFMKRWFNKKIDGYGMYGLGHCSVLRTKEWLRLLSRAGFKQAEVLPREEKTSFFEALEYSLFSPFVYHKEYEQIPVRLISGSIINLVYVLYNLIEKVDFPVFKTDMIIKCFAFKK